MRRWACAALQTSPKRPLTSCRHPQEPRRATMRADDHAQFRRRGEGPGPWTARRRHDQPSGTGDVALLSCQCATPFPRMPIAAVPTSPTSQAPRRKTSSAYPIKSTESPHPIGSTSSSYAHRSSDDEFRANDIERGAGGIVLAVRRRPGFVGPTPIRQCCTQPRPPSDSRIVRQDSATCVFFLVGTTTQRRTTQSRRAAAPLLRPRPNGSSNATSPPDRSCRRRSLTSALGAL
jgi:hypothetical protein